MSIRTVLLTVVFLGSFAQAQELGSSRELTEMINALLSKCSNNAQGTRFMAELAIRATAVRLKRTHVTLDDLLNDSEKSREIGAFAYQKADCAFRFLREQFGKDTLLTSLQDPSISFKVNLLHEVAEQLFQTKQTGLADQLSNYILGEVISAFWMDTLDAESRGNLMSIEQYHQEQLFELKSNYEQDIVGREA